MRPERERVLVGLFVVVAAGVLAGTAIAVWGGIGGSQVSHRMYLKFSGGVQSGTPVRYGGLKVGTVERVQVDPGDSTRIELDLNVDPNAPIKTDSVARLSALGLLSDYYVEISTGTPQAGRAAPGSVLRSVEATGMANIGDTIDSLAPQIHDALDKLTRNLDGLQTTVASANDLLNERNRANIGQALARTNDLLNDSNRAHIADSLNNFNQLLAETRPKISASLDNINSTMEHLTPLLEDAQKTSARVDQTLSNVNSMLTEDRPDLKASLSEMREVLETAKTTVDQLQGILNQNDANIYEILENMRSSAGNIRSLTETIKTSPASLIRGVKVDDRKPGGARK
ncbi:MAG TPA: MlaD family protein [Terriglobia bacterium]|jgi:phospholipid/cholesterol/gamma-HCH transport system substrate-binding protein